jgi:Kef-type K+ transport system membrane component KefB
VATTLIGDIALVVLISTLLGMLVRRLWQPAVIGQILTGILLGPTALGRLPWHLTNYLFPHSVLPSLTALADVAVVIFMFAVGYEIDLRPLRGHGLIVPALAASALAVPMGLGIACVLVYRSGFAEIGESRERFSFVLFMGVAMSITAMPVLAAIVRERGLVGTPAGVVAMAAASIMDVLAWLVLAAALIGTGHSGRFPWPVILLMLCGFVAVLLLGVRPLLTWWTNRSQSVLLDLVPVALVLALSSGWVTAALGLQPIFGGFLAGLTMRASGSAPDENVLRSMDQVARLLLPIFFVVAGLSLDIGTLNSGALVLLGLIVVIACGGKLVPAYAVCRLSRLEPRQAATVAVLVNTRGMTELIALNVGFQDGLLNQRLFTILVLMALLTTLMTGPLLSAIRSVPLAAAVRPAGLRQSARWQAHAPDPGERRTGPVVDGPSAQPDD